jgi:hypothetical protein
MKMYRNRVSEVFRDAFLVKPAHVTTHGGTEAGRFALTEVQAQALMKRGINNMQLLVMNTMFIGGLKKSAHKCWKPAPHRFRHLLN